MGVYFSGTSDDGRMGDNLKFFGEVFGLFWCFLYLIITSFIFMHEGLVWVFTMLGLIVETLIFGSGIVAAIGHRV